MKILISAETVRQAKASGQTSLPAGNNVLITPEARGLADQLGITLDAFVQLLLLHQMFL